MPFLASASNTVRPFTLAAAVQRWRGAPDGGLVPRDRRGGVGGNGGDHAAQRDNGIPGRAAWGAGRGRRGAAVPAHAPGAAGALFPTKVHGETMTLFPYWHCRLLLIWAKAQDHAEQHGGVIFWRSTQRGRMKPTCSSTAGANCGSAGSGAWVVAGREHRGSHDGAGQDAEGTRGGRALST